MTAHLRLPLLLLIAAVVGQVALVSYAVYDPYLYTALFTLIGVCLLRIVEKCLYEPIVRAKAIRIPNIFYIVVKVLVHAILFFVILKIHFGIDVTPLLTTSAVLSFVLGLALQDTLTNLFAGLSLSLEKPYAVGDWILAADLEGQVVDITWRATLVKTRDNNYLTIPNSKISKAEILNYNVPSDISGLWIDVEVAYETPPNRVKEVIHDNLRRMRSVLKEPRPDVWVKEFRDSGIQYGIRVYFHDWQRKGAIVDEVRTTLWYAFKRNHIVIPYPIREVYLHEAGKVVDREGQIEERMNILAGIDIFTNQTEAVLREISQVLEKKHYGKGETVFLEDDEGDSLFIITRGRIAIIKDNHTLAELDKDQFFGEMSVLTGNRRTATAKALKDSDCLCLDKRHFSRVIKENAEIIDKIAAVMAEREMETRRIMYEKEQKVLDAEAARQESEATMLQFARRIRNFFKV